MEKSHVRKKKQKKNAPGKSSSKAEAASCSSDTAETKEKPLKQDDNKLSLITWNVNGRDGEQQPQRISALCDYLTKYSPDVIFLQELNQLYVRLLRDHLAADYTIIEGGDEGFFTMMLLKKSRITLEKSGIVPYPATHMMRNLLVARVLFKGQKFCLMTSQFESCKSNTAERKRQLRLVMIRMSKAHSDVTVLFGGDTSLWDAEVAEVGLPSNVCDVWEQLGSPPHCRYTWDTKVNTNNDIPFHYYSRYDRVYLRRATMDGVPQLEPDRMTLVGLEKLMCGRFTSDHWGIYCTFSAESQCTNKTN